MNNLGPLFFLLSAFGVVAAVQASAFLIRHRTIRRFRVPALLSLTALCIGLLLLLVFVDLSHLQSDILPPIQFYATYITIGVLFGAALLRWFRATESAALNLQWGLACLIIMTTGLFFQDLRRMIRGASGIQTPLISFTLPPSITPTTDTLPAYDSGPEIAPSFDTTEFQAGIAGFARISSLAARDVETLRVISNEFFNKPDTQAERDDKKKLQEFITRLLAIADLAADSTDLIHKCLVPYGELFPDGLPIQDELADIGANISVFASAEADKVGYGTTTQARAPVTPAEKNIEDILMNRVLTQWIDTIQRAATQVWLDSSLREYCEEVSGKVRSDLKYLLANLDPNDFPYRVMLASSAILAAGYPMSSAVILARWLTYNRNQIEGVALRQREFVARMLFHIRALTELDYVLSSAKRYALEERILAELERSYKETVELMFEHRDSAWINEACSGEHSMAVGRLLFGRLVTVATYLSVRSERLERYDVQALRMAEDLVATNYDCFTNIVPDVDVYRREFYIAAAQTKTGLAVELDPLTTADMRDRVRYLEEARELLREVIAMRGREEDAGASEQSTAEPYQNWILHSVPDDQRPDRLLRYVTETLRRIEEAS